MKKQAFSLEKLEPFFDKIGKLSKLYRALISIGACAVIVAPMVFFSYLPKFEQIDNLKKEFADLDQRLTVAKTKAMQLAKFQKMLKEAQEGFALAAKKLPQAKEIPGLLEGITASGQSAGLVFHLFRPGELAKKDFYAEIPVSIVVVGKYSNAYGFFDRIRKLSRIVNLKDIKMSPIGETSDLTTSCTAVTYMFIEGA